MVIAELQDLPIIYYQEIPRYVIATFGNNRSVTLLIVDRYNPTGKSLCRLFEEDGVPCDGHVQRKFREWTRENRSEKKLDRTIGWLFEEVGSDESHEYYEFDDF